MQKLNAGQEHAEDWDGKDEMLNIGQHTPTHPQNWILSFNKLC